MMKYSDFTALLTDARNEWAYVADIDTHEILFMTRAAMKAVGLRSEEEYRSKKCHQILQGLETPCSFCTSRHQPAGQSSYVWEQYNPVVRKWLRLENRLFELEGRRCRCEWATDISGEHATISSLQNQLEREQVLMKSIRTLALEPDAHTAVNLFLQYIGTYHQADRACIFEINYAGRVVNNTYEWCGEGVQSQMSHFQDAPLDFVTKWMEESGDDAPQQRSLDSEKETAMEGVLSSRGVDKLLIVPLRKDNVLVGFLGVDNARAYADDSTLLRLSADLITEEFQKRQLVWDLGSREYTDRLTGLQNRNKYLQVLEEYRRHPPKSLAVFFLDLNGLKELNEERGHDAGDRFICQCADVLQGLGLNAFRVDGDEFVILQPEADLAAAQRRERTLRAALESLQPCSVSLGFAWGEKNVDVMVLVTEADERMYAEKQIYYRKALAQDLGYRTGMATDVLRDIRAGNFAVYFQPQIALKTGAIYGAEALVRKLDSEGRIVPPDRFVPLYEAEGVVSHMDFHVLEQVCALMRTWGRELGKYPNISVNFSRLTLMEPDVVSRICGICREYGIQPRQITIEVTESTGKLSQEQLHGLVHNLQEAGFAVSLDDFGSRYSNLSILTSIDFQLIKLDKSLIDQIGHEEKGTKIVKNLVNLCRDTISTPSLAEGVETLEQAKILRDFSCDYVQGYYFSRPIPAADFTAMLKEGKTFPV